jgi:5-methylcytosine-specific restriction endonuclease McrBC regulatory subunit McrC
MQKTTDNNCGNYTVQALHYDDFKKIANLRIRDLQLEDNKNLLVFPTCLNQYGDKIGDERIFLLQDFKLTTGNILGFVGVNDSELTIQSRFAKKDNDYFLHYLLQKVFCINMFDLKHSYSQENIFDFLLYLFPFYLKKAVRQGLFKEYRHKEYNNINVRGSIDVSRHIQNNIPYKGNIAYRTKEYNYDNRVTQLIRHTIEYIRQHKFGNSVLSNDPETQTCITQIRLATPNYDKNKRRSIINNNLQPISHPYFYEYHDLRKICLQILRCEGLKYGDAKDKVYGLLFDGAWLWEEYLNTILIKYNFNHPENKMGKNAIYLFEKDGYKRFPDFWKEDLILDAKYKRLNEKDSEKIDRNDMHQVITYMYIKQAKIGGFICPSDKKDGSFQSCLSIGKLNGYAGEIKLWKLSIPQSAEDYSDFCNKMKVNEHEFENSLVTYC